MSRRRRHQSQPKPPTAKEWKAAVLEWLDTLDETDLPEGFTKDEVRQAVDGLARTARPDGKGGWIVEVPW